MNKRQKQLALLGALIVLTLFIVAVMFFRAPAVDDVPAYVPPSVDTGLDAAVLEHPEYAELSQPVPLPVRPVETGRDNPFIPY